MKLYRTFYFNRIKFIAILKKIYLESGRLGGADVGGKKSVGQVSGTIQLSLQWTCAGYNLDTPVKMLLLNLPDLKSRVVVTLIRRLFDVTQ